jgi:hypothetical protein
MSDKNLPILFIFDLDGTIIGNPADIISYSKIIKYIKNGCRHKRLNGSECEIDTTIWSTKNIPKYFVRPNYGESLHQIKSTFPTAEFFIFSLGTKDYVVNIIQYLEKYTGIYFNRPLFVRDDSSLTPEGAYLKDINGYYDKIFANLSHRYPKCKNKDIQNKIINERTIIVDDNEVWNNSHQLIKCKPYTYKPIIEIDNAILEIIQSNKSVFTYSNNDAEIKILPTIYETQPYDIFKMNYHMLLTNQYRIESENNIQQQKDDFFPKFTKYVVKRKNKTKLFDKTFFRQMKTKFT